MADVTITDLNQLQPESLSMVADVIIDESSNEKVGVIIPRLQSQQELNVSAPACLLKLVWEQLTRQEFVVFPLQNHSGIFERDLIRIFEKKLVT